MPNPGPLVTRAYDSSQAKTFAKILTPQFYLVASLYLHHDLFLTTKRTILTQCPKENPVAHTARHIFLCEHLGRLTTETRELFPPRLYPLLGHEYGRGKGGRIGGWYRFGSPPYYPQYCCDKRTRQHCPPTIPTKGDKERSTEISIQEAPQHSGTNKRRNSFAHVREHFFANSDIAKEVHTKATIK
jgi:hypothetical protein